MHALFKRLSSTPPLLHCEILPDQAAKSFDEMCAFVRLGLNLKRVSWLVLAGVGNNWLPLLLVRDSTSAHVASMTFQAPEPCLNLDSQDRLLSLGNSLFQHTGGRADKETPGRLEGIGLTSGGVASQSRVHSTRGLLLRRQLLPHGVEARPTWDYVGTEGSKANGDDSLVSEATALHEKATGAGSTSKAPSTDAYSSGHQRSDVETLGPWPTDTHPRSPETRTGDQGVSNSILVTPNPTIRATVGRLVRTTVPDADSGNRVTFKWVSSGNDIQVAVAPRPALSKPKISPTGWEDYSDFETEQAKHYRTLCELLSLLQNLLKQNIPWKPDVTFNMLKEECDKIKNILTTITKDVLNVAKPVEFEKIKRETFSHYESYTLSLQLISKVFDLCIGMKATLGEIGRFSNLASFENLLEITSRDVNYAAKQIHIEMGRVIQKMENSIDLIPPNIGVEPWLKYKQLISQTSEATLLSAEEALVISEKPTAKRSVKDIANKARKFLSTLENLKACERRLRERKSASISAGEYDVLENELKELGKNLNKSGTAKVWSFEFSRKKADSKQVRAETLVEDILLCNFFMKALDKIVLENEGIKYKNNDETFHDLVFTVMAALKNSLSKAHAIHLENLAEINSIQIRTPRIDFDGMGYLSDALRYPSKNPTFLAPGLYPIISKTMRKLLNFQCLNLSQKEALAALKLQLTSIQRWLRGKSKNVLQIALHDQVVLWLGKIASLELKLRPNVRNSAYQEERLAGHSQKYLDYELENLIQEIVLVYRQLKPFFNAPTLNSSKMNLTKVLPLKKMKGNTYYSALPKNKLPLNRMFIEPR